jgi:hypothetical protein
MNNPETSHFLFYGTESGKTSVQVIVDADKETIWTTQKGMSEIFDTTQQNVAEHLKNIFNSGELLENQVLQRNLVKPSTSGGRPITYYNLDAIIQ